MELRVSAITYTTSRQCWRIGNQLKSKSQPHWQNLVRCNRWFGNSSCWHFARLSRIERWFLKEIQLREMQQRGKKTSVGSDKQGPTRLLKLFIMKISIEPIDFASGLCEPCRYGCILREYKISITLQILVWAVRAQMSYRIKDTNWGTAFDRCLTPTKSLLYQ